MQNISFTEGINRLSTNTNPFSNCAAPPWYAPYPAPELNQCGCGEYQYSSSSSSSSTNPGDSFWISVINSLIEANKNNKENKGETKMFNTVRNGDFRLDTNGRIAVRTSKGYKVYNVNKKRLVNCENFVFDIGDEWFFTMPTTKAKVGDIILFNNTPKCVMKVNDDTITVINYENSVVEEILPERHIFMGNAYFYIKVVSMFGSNNSQKKSSKKMLKWMLMSKLFKSESGCNSGFSIPMNMNPMAMMFMSEMFKDSDDDFNGLFDFDFDFELEEEKEDTEDE